MDLSKLDFEHFIYIHIKKKYPGEVVNVITDPASFIEHVTPIPEKHDFLQASQNELIYNTLLEEREKFSWPDFTILKVPRDLKASKQYFI